MKAVLIAEAIGFGHITRDIEILNKLRKEGWKTEVITYGKCASLVEKEKFKVHPIPLSVDIKENTKGIDVNKTIIDNIKAAHIGSIKKMNDVLYSSKPDVILVDTNVLGIIASDFYTGFRKTPIAYLANGNDIGSFGGGMVKTGGRMLSRYVGNSADVMFVPDVPLPYTITEYNLEIFSNTKFLGPITRFNRKKTQKNTGGVFVTLGRSGIEARKFLDYINRTDENILKHDENSYDRVFMKSEVVVHHGGHSTAMEAAVLGKPQVVIPQNGFVERYFNAKKLAELGIAVVLDDRWIDEKVLGYAIEEARSKKKNAARFAGFLKKYDGSKNACREIAAIANIK